MSVSVKQGRSYRKRRSGAIRKATSFVNEGGIRRVRLKDEDGRVTKVRVDQFGKTYEPV